MATSQSDELIEELSRPVIKLGVALIALYFLRFIVGFLPGLGALELPATFISLQDIATAAITAVMVAILVKFAMEMEPKLKSVLSGPTDIVADFVDIVKYLVFLIAIVLAYGGFAGIWYGLPLTIPFLYDLVFFVAAVIPTILIAVKLFTNLDEITDLLTEQVKDAAVDDVTCPGCGETVRASLDFCPDCGEDVTGVEPTGGQSAASTCPDCESGVEPDMEFCGSCGAELGGD